MATARSLPVSQAIAERFWSPKSMTDERDIIGYEGVLDDLIYDKSEIQAVHLSDCTPFYLRKEKGSLSKVDINTDKKNIPFLYFPKEEIRNISFTVFIEPEPDVPAETG